MNTKALWCLNTGFFSPVQTEGDGIRKKTGLCSVSAVSQDCGNKSCSQADLEETRWVLLDHCHFAYFVTSFGGNMGIPFTDT